MASGQARSRLSRSRAHATRSRAHATRLRAHATRSRAHAITKTCVITLQQFCQSRYGRCGVATTCRLLQIIGLFCKRALEKRLYSAKETCDLKDPTDRSHPIVRARDVIAKRVSKIKGQRYRRAIWKRYAARIDENYRSLLQNIVSFKGLVCKRDL